MVTHPVSWRRIFGCFGSNFAFCGVFTAWSGGFSPPHSNCPHFYRHIILRKLLLTTQQTTYRFEKRSVGKRKIFPRRRLISERRLYLTKKCVILYSETARQTEIGSFVSQISETAVNGSAVRVFLYNNYYRRSLCR